MRNPRATARRRAHGEPASNVDADRRGLAQAARRARRARGSCRGTAFRPLLRAARRRCARKNAIVASDRKARAGHVRTIAARPPQKSRSVTTVLVTLQREPPLTRILAPGFLAPSSSDDGKRRVRAACEDRGREAGGAGPDDRDIAGFRGECHAQGTVSGCRTRVRHLSDTCRTPPCAASPSRSSPAGERGLPFIRQPLERRDEVVHERAELRSSRVRPNPSNRIVLRKL